MDFPEKVDHRAHGGVMRCPGCGMHHYADGGAVETTQQRLDRHEQERQKANDSYTENAMSSLRADRPRVAVSDDERKPRPKAMDTAQASNYAYGGSVDDPEMRIPPPPRGYDDADDRPEFEDERRYANDGMRSLDRRVHRGWQSEAPKGRDEYAGEGNNYAHGGEVGALTEYLVKRRGMRKAGFGYRNGK